MSATVLIVDDNEENVRITSAMLRGGGFDVREACSGESALHAIYERPPDVVLLDIMMPTMDGLQVLGHLRQDPRHAQLPVIVVTAKADDDDVLAGYRGGADYYIIKPVTRRQLLHALDLVLGPRVSRKAG